MPSWLRDAAASYGMAAGTYALIPNDDNLRRCALAEVLLESAVRRFFVDEKKAKRKAEQTKGGPG